jgi:hypothetical protein
MGAEADRCVCLARPELFEAVGQWYIDFQVHREAGASLSFVPPGTAGLFLSNKANCTNSFGREHFGPKAQLCWGQRVLGQPSG